MRQESDRGDGQAGGTMRARRWAIAALYHEPSDYDIPKLPDWASGQDEQGRLCFGEDRGSAPFIMAANPTKVRR